SLLRGLPVSRETLFIVTDRYRGQNPPLRPRAPFHVKLAQRNKNGPPTSGGPFRESSLVPQAAPAVRIPRTAHRRALAPFRFALLSRVDNHPTLRILAFTLAVHPVHRGDSVVHDLSFERTHGAQSHRLTVPEYLLACRAPQLRQLLAPSGSPA